MPVSRSSLQRQVEKRLLNPGMRAMILAGYAPRLFVLIETTGRRTGLRRLTPVQAAVEDHAVWLVAEHGWRSAFVQNIAANPQVRIKRGRQWLSGHATIVADEDPWARRERIDRLNGWMGRADGVIFRKMASTPLAIRVRLDH
jgi:deazaflavin-dependent oxidoreductase (nitroreductase family)